MLAERALTDSLNLFGDTLILICYHVSQTYENSYSLQREAFYDTNLPPPFVIFDGTNLVVESNPSMYEEVYTDAYDIARTVTPLFNINIQNATASVSQGSFDLQIVTADTLPEDDIHAFVVICEDSLPGGGGAYMFLYVCRDLQDIPLDLVYPDTLNEAIVFSHSIEVNKLSAIVFVQDMDTREVMQSIMTRF